MKSPYGDCYCIKPAGLASIMPTLLLCHHSESEELDQAEQSLQLAFIELTAGEDHNLILTNYFGRNNRDNIKEYVANIVGAEAYNQLNPAEQKIAMSRYMEIESLARELMRIRMIRRSYDEAWAFFPEGEYNPDGPP